jgi:hypothetical protein
MLLQLVAALSFLRAQQARVKALEKNRKIFKDFYREQCIISN